MKYLILGAGPAGLSFANLLLQKGITDFLVLEKEEEAGGLCRSKQVDGSELDIGGGHFLDVRRPKVNEFLFQYMPLEEWDSYDRDSRIEMKDYTVGHPFEANIWQMPQEEQVAYLKSIALAGCNLGTDMPTRFTQWITWKLGERVAEKYMLPYNRKMFGEDLEQLGTYWLEKLPSVSFEETLLSCLNKKPYGTQPGHARFYYPKKYGYGELWRRMGEALGEKLCTGVTVKSIDFEHLTVTDQNGQAYQADRIITTVPWTAFSEIQGAPEAIVSDIKRLKSTGIEVAYVGENLDTPAQWIYYPEPEKSYHRILVRHNFCPSSKGYWTETNLDRKEPLENRPKVTYAYDNPYAYPLNTVDKPEIMKRLLGFGSLRGVYGLGRWGEHEHYNSDVTVLRAMELVEELEG